MTTFFSCGFRRRCQMQKNTKRIDAYGLGTSFRLMDSEEIGETRKDMLTLLSVADIFILASLQEGLPIALIEAMALGLPCALQQT